MKVGGMIRFVKMAIFPRIQKLFFVRKAPDSIVKVHTIRFASIFAIYICEPCRLEE